MRSKGGRFAPARGTLRKLPPLRPGTPYILKAGRGELPGNPITSDIELATKLQEMCGAEGYRIERGQVLALRWDASGSEVVIDRFELTKVNG